MAVWKKVLTTSPNSGDIASTGVLDGKVLESNATGAAAEWVDKQIVSTATAPTTAAEFDNAGSNMIIENDTGHLYVLKDDGTAIMKLAATEFESLEFAISAFDDGINSAVDQLIGLTSNTWKSAEAISFTASYAHPGTVTGSCSDTETDDVITADITDGSNSATEFTNDATITYPSAAGDSIVFELKVSNDSPSATDVTRVALEIFFYNHWASGDSATSSGTNTLFNGLEDQIVANQNLATWSGTTTMANNTYQWWAYPKSKGKLSTISKVLLVSTTNGTSDGVNKQVALGCHASYGDMDFASPNDLEFHTNDNNYTEAYYSYRSLDQMAFGGAVPLYWDVAALKNYIYTGSTSLDYTASWDSDNVLGGDDCTVDTKWAGNTVNAGNSQVWPDNSGTITVTETENRVYFACPKRLTNAATLTFNDGYSPFYNFNFDKHASDVSVTNAYGYTEDYLVYVSQDALWQTGEPNTIKFFSDNA